MKGQAGADSGPQEVAATPETWFCSDPAQGKLQRPSLGSIPDPSLPEINTTQLRQHGFRRKQANRHNTMHVIHVHSCRYMQPVVLLNTRVQGKECCLLCSPHTRHRNAMPGTRYSRTHTIAHAKRRRTGRCRPTTSFPFSF